MPDTSPPTEAPMPRSVSWFMPWRWFSHWRPWKRWTLFAAVMLFGYLLSPLVSFPLANRLPSSVQDRAEMAYGLFYTPLIFVVEACPPIGVFYETTIEGIDNILTQWGWPSP